MSTNDGSFTKDQLVASIVDLFKMFHYVEDGDDLIEPDMLQFTLDPDMIGMSLNHWLVGLSRGELLERREEILSYLIRERDHSKASHPSQAVVSDPSSDVDEELEAMMGQNMITSAPGASVGTKTKPEPSKSVITEALLVPERSDVTQEVVDKIDALLDSVRGRTLLPSTELIDGLLDLRNGIDKMVSR